MVSEKVLPSKSRIAVSNDKCFDKRRTSASIYRDMSKQSAKTNWTVLDKSEMSTDGVPELLEYLLNFKPECAGHPVMSANRTRLNGRVRRAFSVC